MLPDHSELASPRRQKDSQNKTKQNYSTDSGLYIPLPLLFTSTEHHLLIPLFHE